MTEKERITERVLGDFTAFYLSKMLDWPLFPKPYTEQVYDMLLEAYSHGFADGTDYMLDVVREESHKPHGAKN